MKKITSEEIQEAVALFLHETRRAWHGDLARLARGAIILYLSPAGWRLTWRQNHTRKDGSVDAIARYKIPGDLIRKSPRDTWEALAIFAAVKLAGSARAINANAGRSLATRQRAAAVGVAARSGKNPN